MSRPFILSSLEIHSKSLNGLLCFAMACAILMSFPTLSVWACERAANALPPSVSSLGPLPISHCIDHECCFEASWALILSNLKWEQPAQRLISFPRVLHGAGTHHSTCAFRCHRDIAMDNRTSTCLGTCDGISLHKQPSCLYFAHRYNLRPLLSLGVWHQQCISTWRWDWVNVVQTTASIEILWSVSGIAWRRYRRNGLTGEYGHFTVVQSHFPWYLSSFDFRFLGRQSGNHSQGFHSPDQNFTRIWRAGEFFRHRWSSSSAPPP